jgi:hypothetical protein
MPHQRDNIDETKCSAMRFRVRLLKWFLDTKKINRSGQQEYFRTATADHSFALFLFHPPATTEQK